MTQTTKDYLVRLLKREARRDGRKLSEWRKVVIEKGIGENAEGSARVKLGDTEVIVGIKMQVGEPYPDKPDEGVMITMCEFLPMASSSFEAGPPGEDEIELGRVIDRGIREGKVIDTKKLVIVPGEKVWTVFMDIYVVNDDGNLYDAAALAAMAALTTAKIPKLDENYEIIEGEYEGKLPLNHAVVSLTAYKAGDVIFYDPTHQEESIIDSRLTVGVRDDGKIVSLQKGMEGSWTEEEVLKNIEFIQKKAQTFIKKVMK
ncbi:MAG: exosome complex protein Rrp42 [Candidatus Nanohaloarchaeota archaeon]|nr:exosome complex protein Rrp42 [Candidatus Nanohaloarchaeota archaeon]